MIILYLLFLCIFLVGMRVYIKGYNDDFLSKKQTLIINGLFVVTIFISHMSSYMDNSQIFDLINKKIMSNVGQLMVTTFFFYSGYGILESIKNKADYIKNFPKQRIFKLWFNMSLATLAFFLMKIMLGENISLDDVLQGFLGYSSWFVLITLILYIIISLVFSNFIIKKASLKKRTYLFSLISIILVGILGIFWPNFYTNTFLCFPFGMMLSLYKDNIIPFVKKRYWRILICTSIVFLLLFFVKKKFSIDNDYFYNCLSMIFVTLVTLISMKVKLDNKIFEFFGKHVFWVYMLQRIPRTILVGKIENNVVYSIVTFAFTIALSVLMDKLSKYIFKHG